MIRDPKLFGVQGARELQLIATYQTARTYHFRATERLGGWALCTVNDTTGELLIVSDWGNWSYIWNPKHLGSPSLTHFITDRQGYDYLACKLLGPRDRRVIDADKTIAKWRRRLCAQRLKEGRQSTDWLDANLAREIWHGLGSLYDDERNEAIFIEHACRIDGFTRWISSEPWEEVEHHDSHEYRVLVDYLLPALAAACRVTIEQVESPEACAQ